MAFVCWCAFKPSFLSSFILLFPPSFLHSFLHSYLHSFIHSFLPSYLYSFIPSFILSFILSFLPSFTHSFLHSFLPSFILSFLPLFFPSFLPPFLLSFIHLFIHCCYSSVSWECWEEDARRARPSGPRHVPVSGQAESLAPDALRESRWRTHFFDEDRHGRSQRPARHPVGLHGSSRTDHAHSWFPWPRYRISRWAKKKYF